MERLRFATLAEFLNYCVYIAALAISTFLYLLASYQLLYGILYALTKDFDLSIMLAFKFILAFIIAKVAKSIWRVKTYEQPHSKTGKFYIDPSHDYAAVILIHSKIIATIVFGTVILTGHVIVRDTFLRNVIISYALTVLSFISYHIVNDDMFEWSERFYARQNKKD